MSTAEYIADNWFNDIPQQFQSKEKIEVIINAFSKQLSDLENIFFDLNDKTSINNATGIHLDMIGDILNMPRKDAYQLINASDEELTDETYRKILIYQSIKNSSNCTYDDIMKITSILMKTDILSYKENETGIEIHVKDIDIDTVSNVAVKILLLKPAGVSFKYFIDYLSSINFKNIQRIELEAVDVNVTMTWFEYLMLNGSFLLDGTEMLDVTYNIVMNIETEED